MPLPTDLHAAGARAAAQPVPVPPAIDLLRDRANKKQAKRRLVGSGLAAAAFLGLAVPAVLSMQGQTVVQEVATAGISQTAQAASQGSASQDPANPAAAMQDDDAEQSSDDTTARFEMRFGDDLNFAGRVLTGDAAASAATDAQAAADETRTIDGQVLWISRDGDRATVSALIDGQDFIEVSGPSDQLDRLLDMAASGLPPVPPVPPLPAMPALPELEEFFEGLEGLEGFEADDFFERFGQHSSDGFSFDFDFDLEQDGDGEGPRFEFNFGEPGDDSGFELFFEGELGDALSNGDFSELEGFFEDLERDFGNFEQRFENGEFGDHSFFNSENFDGCITISGSNGDADTSLQFPPGCSADN